MPKVLCKLQGTEQLRFVIFTKGRFVCHLYEREYMCKEEIFLPCLPAFNLPNLPNQKSPQVQYLYYLGHF